MNSSQRRMQAEWDLLQNLMQLNPDRISGVSAEDRILRLTLHDCPAILLRSNGVPQSTHTFRLRYPQHFPTVPMELYIDQPCCHPNVHPETGFVCLWDRHLVSNTAEHAVHKLVAMLSGRLFNLEARHVMQPNALQCMRSTHLIEPLIGITHDETPWESASSTGRPVRRNRLT